ncbi:MAG: hypothetical protein RLY86_3828 [Pseudomonadota bacterium]|jgi:chromosome partitioning protein
MVTTTDNPVEASPAEEFRQLRTRTGLSQSNLAREINRRLDRSYDTPRVSRWENGREAIPADVVACLRSIAQVRKARVIALANQKGGVAKTTSTLNLAAAAVARGYKALVIDMDPQASASSWALGTEAAMAAYRAGRTMVHLLEDAPFSKVVIRGDQPITGQPRVDFDVMTSHIELSEVEIRREPGMDNLLRGLIDPLRTAYDLIVIDCPPNLGILTWMALAAADEVLIPVRTEALDSMGVGLILTTINKVKRRSNPKLAIAGVLPTQFDRRKFVDREVLRQLAAALEEVPLLDPVPDAAIFGRAALEGRIVAEMSPTSPGAEVYARLAQALIAMVPPARYQPVGEEV